jgi:AraC-like DNA-binding protein
MDIEVFKPRDERLKNIINNYYILDQYTESKTAFLTFPKTFSILTIIKNATLELSADNCLVQSVKEETLVSDLITSYKKPILVTTEGKLKEITIYFKPLGINSFVHNLDVQTVNNRNFLPYPEYSLAMTNLFLLESNDDIISKLEEYLVSKLSIFSHPFLHEFIREISQNLDLSILEFSSRHGIHPKRLIRHSKKYLNRTPLEFKKVLRFNRVLEEYLKSENKSLSATDVESFIHYFDQAHMIKDFKSMTGYTPKVFFKRLNSSNPDLNWIFNEL